MGVGNTKQVIEPMIKGRDLHNNQILVGDTALKVQNGTAVRDAIDTAGKTASRVLVSSGDILTAPSAWLSDMQKNWLTYMVVVAIILSILAFFYCSYRFYFNRKINNSSNSNLVELAKVISNKTGILQQQQQLPLSILNLPSVPSNTPLQ
jgi:hypothetical protein